MLLLFHNPFRLTVCLGAPFRLLHGLYSVLHYMLFWSRVCHHYVLSPIFSLMSIYIVSSPHNQCHKETLNILHTHVQARKQEIGVNSTHLLLGDHTPMYGYWIATSFYFPEGHLILYRGFQTSQESLRWLATNFFGFSSKPSFLFYKQDGGDLRDCLLRQYRRRIRWWPKAFLLYLRSLRNLFRGCLVSTSVMGRSHPPQLIPSETQHSFLVCFLYGPILEQWAPSPVPSSFPIFFA